MNAIPGLPVPDRKDRRATGRPGRYRAKPEWLASAPSTARHGSRDTGADCAESVEARFLPVGDTGVSVQFGTDIHPDINDAVAALDRAIAAADLPGVIETVPSFRSLLVVFEPASVDREALCVRLRALTLLAARTRRPSGRLWSLPVVYQPPFGEDLAEVSGLLGMPERDIVAAHTRAEFRVYMLGFQPGLPNLGGLPPELQISRRATPRPPVPGGSVMIGGVQGAIMPLPTPSGFYLLGRTPVRLFDRRRPEPALLKAGDRLRFRAVCADEYTAVAASVAEGNLDAGAVLEFAGAA
jgi:KipI family sensor histidine kinase inhibitor